MRAWCGGITSVPQIFLNSTLLRGGNANLQALEGAGKLDDVLAEGLASSPLQDELPVITFEKLPPRLQSLLDQPVLGFAGLERGTVEESELREAYQRMYFEFGNRGAFTRETLFIALDDTVWDQFVECGVIIPAQPAAWWWWPSLWQLLPQTNNTQQQQQQYFCFSQDRNPTVLNMVFDNARRRVRIAQQKRTALELSALLRGEIAKLHSKYLSANGRRVNYLQMKESEEFTLYVDLTHELQLVDLKELFVEADRKAFFINVYNALAVHGFCVLGYPTTAAQRAHFFSATSYRLGASDEYCFSLNDIEHGVLRANRPTPAGFLPFFRGTKFSSLPLFSSDDDPRFRYVVHNLDCRIHFALNCGAKSCPPIRVYSAENLEAELDSAAQAFCDDEEMGVKIDLPAKQVTMSQIFKWYATDFGDTERERLEKIGGFLFGTQRETMRELLVLGDEFTVQYFPYDWNSNALTAEEVEL